MKRNGIYCVVMDLPFIAVLALRSLSTSQESSSREFVCCSLPVGLVQEPTCTIAITVQLCVAFLPIPGCSVLYSCSTAFLGSTEGAGHVIVDFEVLCELPWRHVHAYKEARGVRRYLLLLQEILCNTSVWTCGCRGIFTYVNAKRPGSVICILPQPFVCKDLSWRMACTCFHNNWRSTCEAISCSWFSISPGLHLHEVLQWHIYHVQLQTLI